MVQLVQIYGDRTDVTAVNLGLVMMSLGLKIDRDSAEIRDRDKGKQSVTRLGRESVADASCFARTEPDRDSQKTSRPAPATKWPPNHTGVNTHTTDGGRGTAVLW